MVAMPSEDPVPTLEKEAARPAADRAGSRRPDRGDTPRPPATVVITGVSGFLGQAVLRRLAGSPAVGRLVGLDVREPGFRPRGLEFHLVDVAGSDLRPLFDGADVLVHLAARVGVGQSMYEIAEYTSVNALGTATLLEALLDHPVERLLVASSMSVYGEGLYLAPDGTPSATVDRSRQQLEQGQWEPRGPQGERLTPAPTPETKPSSLASVYALNKYEQEQMCLLFGAAYNVPTVALRFFNVHGTRQALSNPYTGVLAIFASRLLNDRPPLVFEDGEQRRDFVSVRDVARACLLALQTPAAAGEVFNIGSGRSVSINEVAATLAQTLGKSAIRPEVTGKYRVGDIRHCFADITKASSILGYQPRVGFEEGVQELVEWLQGQKAVDKVDAAAQELSARGLTW